MKRMVNAPNQGRCNGWRRKLQRALNELVSVRHQWGDEGPHRNPGWACCTRCGLRPKVIHKRAVGVIMLYFCELHLRMAEAGR